jgi:hypothetical protein
MFLQAIIGTSLETPEDFYIGTLHLSIALWMSNIRIAYLGAKIFAVPLEDTASKLGPIVSDDDVWDPKSADDRLDEPYCELSVDFDH